MRAWDLIRDVLATGTGLAMIWLQVFSQHPNETLLVVAMVLTTPSISKHSGVSDRVADRARELLAGPSGQHSSPSSRSPSPPGSGPSGTEE